MAWGVLRMLGRRARRIFYQVSEFRRSVVMVELIFFFSLLLFKMVSCYVVQTGLEPWAEVILLPPEYWVYRHELPPYLSILL